MLFTKEDIYNALDLVRESKSQNSELAYLHNSQLELSRFLNGGMKGHLKHGQKHEINFLGHMLLFLFISRYEENYPISSELLTNHFNTVQKESIDALNIDESILLAFLHDAIYSSPQLDVVSVPVAYNAICAVLKSFIDVYE